MRIVLIIAPWIRCLATVPYTVIMVPARVGGPCRVHMSLDELLPRQALSVGCWGKPMLLEIVGHVAG